MSAGSSSKAYHPAMAAGAAGIFVGAQVASIPTIVIGGLINSSSVALLGGGGALLGAIGCGTCSADIALGKRGYIYKTLDDIRSCLTIITGKHSSNQSDENQSLVTENPIKGYDTMYRE